MAKYNLFTYLLRFGSGMTKLMILNEEMDDITKIVKSFDESDLLVKDVSEAIKDEAKKQKRGFRSMLLVTLGATLLGKFLTGNEVKKAGEETIKAGQHF